MQSGGKSGVEDDCRFRGDRDTEASFEVLVSLVGL